MLNKVTLIGNLGNDPEIKHMPSGGQVATLSVATTRRWKNKDTSEKVEETEWHRVVAFGKLAEIIGEYVKKGQQIYISGRLKTRKWQGDDGKDRYTTEIIADEMHMLGRKESVQQADKPSHHQTPTPPAPAPQHDYEDDDIPF